VTTRRQQSVVGVLLYVVSDLEVNRYSMAGVLRLLAREVGDDAGRPRPGAGRMEWAEQGRGSPAEPPALVDERMLNLNNLRLPCEGEDGHHQ
jgi:hypothetical protein